MKTVLFLTICVAVSLAFPTSFDTVLKQYKEECQMEGETNLNSMSNNIPKENLTPEDKENCLFACIYTKMGIMNADGTYNKDLIYINVSLNSNFETKLNTKGRLTRNLRKCTEEAGEDRCKLAGCIYNARVNFMFILMLH